MFETLFGAEMPLAIRFLLAFLISLGLIGAIIGAATWAARRFGAGRLGETSTRALEPRLAVVAYANVDERRQLILVRRDNVEHLLMIGWWADVTVEPNIARAVSEPHEAVVARSPVAAEPLPRGIPLPDKGSWPPLLEPTDAERPAPRTESSPEEPAASPLQPQGETTPRSQRYAPAPLADELSTLPPAPHKSPTAVTRPHLTESRPESRFEHRGKPRLEPRITTLQPAAAQPTATEATSTADETLAALLHRLATALRKSNEATAARRPAAPARPAPSLEWVPAAETAPTPSSAALVPRPSEPKPAPADAKLIASKTLFDSLAKMASLLGRPTTH